MKKYSSGSGPVRAKRAGLISVAGQGVRSPRIKRQWKPYYQKLLELRERLMGDRAEQLVEISEPLECGGRDIAKSARDESSQDLALSHVAAEQNILSEIDEALERLQNGTYGICQLTHLPIEKERLQAVPWTRFSKSAAEHVEKQTPANDAKSLTTN